MYPPARRAKVAAIPVHRTQEARYRDKLLKYHTSIHLTNARKGCISVDSPLTQNSCDITLRCSLLASVRWKALAAYSCRPSA
jgi:hypothetical protein